MHTENLRGVDLNLLVVLEALLEEHSVTRAARRLAMTQPAVSHALSRLRSLFDDPLLERHGRTMKRTPRAEVIAEPLGRVLSEIRGLTAPAEETKIADVERTLRVSMMDLAMTTLLPALLTELAKEAPGVTLVCRDWSVVGEEIERLRRSEIDLSLTNLGAPPRDLRRAPLGHVAFVGIARRKHPMFAAKRPQPHRERFVIVSSSGRTEGPLDGALAARGRRRRVVAAVPMYTAVPSLVAQTDLVAYVPEPLARRTPERNKLRTFRAPRGLVRQPVDLVWHERSHADPVHRFVRERFAAVSKVVWAT
ncbi:MAG: LysR family transcriptional regulator [Deltaproteobacteria bacterium]